MMVSVNPIDRQIGANIRVLREQRGLTQSQLAKSVGAPPSDMDRYETGATSAPVSLVVKLARALQVTASELIGDDQASWTEAVGDLARAGPEGTIDLVSAFSSIPDDRVRRAFLDLAWTIVDAQTQAAPEE
jgi:transcriptional regulator with XRE-family HTH domain